MSRIRAAEGVNDFLKVSDLLLDSENPRLSPSAKRMSQDDLLILFEREFELSPVARSMADNGYFAEEPLVVIPSQKSDGKFIVVEGNRRLAALKFLTDSDKRKLSRDREFWDGLARTSRFPLDKVPVIRYETRDQLVSLLGFRHIAGVLKWDPLQKARFITSLVVQMGSHADFDEVSRVTGAAKNTIRDNYVAYRLYCQAKDRFDIDTSKLEKDFSVFFRALSYERVQKFIGLGKNKSIKELETPISRAKRDALEELIGFVHGTQKVRPVFSDSRQLKKLGDVLASPGALEYLRNSRNLELAFDLAGGEEKRLVKNLQRANFYLDESLKDAHRHTQDRDVEALVERCAASMFQVLKNFPAIESKLRGGNC